MTPFNFYKTPGLSSYHHSAFRNTEKKSGFSYSENLYVLDCINALKLNSPLDKNNRDLLHIVVRQLSEDTLRQLEINPCSITDNESEPGVFSANTNSDHFLRQLLAQGQQKNEDIIGDQEVVCLRQAIIQELNDYGNYWQEQVEQFNLQRMMQPSPVNIPGVSEVIKIEQPSMALQRHASNLQQKIISKLVGECLQRVLADSVMENPGKIAPRLLVVLKRWHSLSCADMARELRQVFSGQPGNATTETLYHLFNELAALLDLAGAVRQRNTPWDKLHAAIENFKPLCGNNSPLRQQFPDLAAYLQQGLNVTAQVVEKLQYQQLSGASDALTLLADPQLLNQLLPESASGLAAVATEVNQLWQTLRKIQQLSPGASYLQQTGQLLRLINSSELGNLLSNPLYSGLQPVFDGLNQGLKLLDKFKSWPLQGSINQQLRYLAQLLSDTSLPMAPAPMQSLIGVVAEIQKQVKGVKPWPDHRIDQARWLLDIAQRVEAQYYLPSALQPFIALAEKANKVSDKVLAGGIPQGLMAQAQWFSGLLSDPVVHSLLQLLLPENVFTPVRMLQDISQQASPVLERMKAYPQQGTVAEKSAWALQLCTTPQTLKLLSQFVPDSVLPASFRQTLDGLQKLWPLLDAWRKLPANASYLTTLHTMTGALISSLTAHPELLLMVLKQYPQINLPLGTAMAWKRMPENLSWTAQLSWMATEGLKEIGSSWQYLFHGVKEAPKFFHALSGGYQLWKNWHSDPQRAEQILKPIGKLLVDSAGDNPQIKALAEMLPLLPALSEVMVNFRRADPDAPYSWQDINQLMGQLDASKSSLLKDKVLQLEEGISDAAASLLTGGFDKLMASLASLMPGVDARVLPLSTTAGLEVPREPWVRSEIQQLIEVKYQSLRTSEAGASTCFSAEVWEKLSAGLTEKYIQDYRNVYLNRNMPELQAVIEEKKRLIDIDPFKWQVDPWNKIKEYSQPETGEEYWLDRLFQTNIIEEIVSDNIGLDDISITGNVDNILRNLFVASPMESQIKQQLTATVIQLLHEEINKYDFADESGELFIHALPYINKVIAETMAQYRQGYQQMLQGENNNPYKTTLSAYEFWYGENAVQDFMQSVIASTNSFASQLHKIINLANDNVRPGEEMVETEGFNKFVTAYNDFQNKAKSYKENFNFSELRDWFVKDELEAINSKFFSNDLKDQALHPDSKIKVKFTGPLSKQFNEENKQYSMKEVAMGKPNLDAKGYDSPIYSTNISLHKAIRAVPGNVQKRLTMAVDNIQNIAGAQESINAVFDVSFKASLRQLVKNGDKAVVKEFKQAIRQFIAGKATPLLPVIKGEGLSHIIGLKGSNNRYLLISALDNQCAVVNEKKISYDQIDGLVSIGQVINTDNQQAENLTEKESDKKFISWLSQHLSYASQKNADTALHYFPLRIDGFSLEVLPYDDPINWDAPSDVTQYQSEIFKRYLARIKSDADATIKTQGEKNVDLALDLASYVTGVLSLAMPATFSGRLIALFLGLMAEPAAEIGKFFNADSQEEKDEALWGAILAIASGGFDINDVLKAYRKKLAKQVLKDNALLDKLPQAKKITREPLPDLKNPYWQKKIIAQAKSSTLFRVDTNTVIKQYKNHPAEEAADKLYRHLPPHNPVKSTAEAIFQKNVTKANNNVVALNRLYGKGTADLIVSSPVNGKAGSVAIRMKEIAGDSLDTILNKGSGTEIAAILKIIKEKGIAKIANELSDKLRNKGVYFPRLDMKNIIYDKNTGQFKPGDFEKTKITALKTTSENGNSLTKIEPLSERQAYGIRNDIEDCLELFSRASTIIGNANPVIKLYIKGLKNAFVCPRIKRSLDPTTCMHIPLTRRKLEPGVNKFIDFLEKGKFRKFWDPNDLNANDKADKLVNLQEMLAHYQWRVKGSLYRAHLGTEQDIMQKGLLRNPHGQDINNFEDYIKWIIRHVGSKDGSQGRVLSLSTKKYVSKEDFMGPGKHLVKMDIDKHSKQFFMSTTDVLVWYGGYAVKKDIVTKEELSRALYFLNYSCLEREMFFMGKYAGYGWGELPAGKDLIGLRIKESMIA